MCNDQSSILSCRLSAVPAEVRRSRGLRAREPCLFGGAGSSQPKNERAPLCPQGKSPWPLRGPALPVVMMALEMSDTGGGSGGESLAVALVRCSCWEEA